MAMQGGKVPFGLVLVAGFALAACGGDAESAEEGPEVRVIPSAESASEAPDGPTLDAAPAEPESPEPAEVARPTLTSQEEPAEPTAGEEEGARVSESPADAGAGEETQVTSREVEPVISEPAFPVPGEEIRPEDIRAEPPPLAVPAGTEVELVLETTLSTEDDPVGTLFHAHLVEDLLGAGGVVLLPRGTLARGRVVESRESPSSDEPAVLRLALEEIRTGERFRPLRATIVDIGVKADARDSDAEVGAKVGAGAVAGAILGKILGKSGEDALKGAVVGAAAGAAVAIATRDGHAEVKEGAVLRAVIDELLVVESP